MSKTVASIFDALKYVLLIAPIYHVNWLTMKQLLMNEIHIILKERGMLVSLCFLYSSFDRPFFPFIGASGAARASEIETFCLNLFYRYLASEMTREHFQIFVFFHSFFMSIKQHWLRKSDDEIKNEKFLKKDQFPTKTTTRSSLAINKSSSETNNSKIEHQVYNALYNALKSSRQQVDVPIISYTHSHLKKPNFMSINNWLNCIQLEKSGLSNVFSGLSESLANDSEKWYEYFHCKELADADHHFDNNNNNVKKNSFINYGNAESKLDIDLLNECPLKNENLNVFYKFLIWLTAQSNMAIEIINKFNVYNFGGLIPTHHEFDLKFFYSITSPYKPNLILINQNGK